MAGGVAARRLCGGRVCWGRRLMGAHPSAATVLRVKRNDRLTMSGRAGDPAAPAPGLTNEVQHLVKVLSWEKNIHRSPLKSDCGLPTSRPTPVVGGVPGWSGMVLYSRLVLLARLPGKHADVTADTIARLLAPLPPALCQPAGRDHAQRCALDPKLTAASRAGSMEPLET